MVELAMQIKNKPFLFATLASIADMWMEQNGGTFSKGTECFEAILSAREVMPEDLVY